MSNGKRAYEVHTSSTGDAGRIRRWPPSIWVHVPQQGMHVRLVQCEASGDSLARLVGRRDLGAWTRQRETTLPFQGVLARLG